MKVTSAVRNPPFAPARYQPRLWVPRFRFLESKPKLGCGRMLSIVWAGCQMLPGRGNGLQSLQKLVPFAPWSPDCSPRFGMEVSVGGEGASARRECSRECGEPLPMNRSATVLKASRSGLDRAAVGLRHSRAPARGFKARTLVGRNLSLFVPHGERDADATLVPTAPERRFAMIDRGMEGSGSGGRVLANRSLRWVWAGA